MNFITKRCTRWAVAMAILALPGAMLTSCSKDTDTEQVRSTEGSIKVNVAGIQKSAKAKALRESAGASTATAQQAKYEVYEFSDVDVAVSQSNEIPVQNSAVTGRGKANKALSAAVGEDVELLANDVTFVVQVYEGNTFVSSAVLKSGEDGYVNGLDPNVEYTWKAFSFNNTADLTAWESSATVALPEDGADVLYATSGSTTFTTAVPSIDITFEHKLSRVGIELNTIGVFGEISGPDPQVSVKGLRMQPTSLNMADGAIAGGNATADVELDWENFEQIEDGHADRFVAWVYSAPLTTGAKFQVSVGNLTITHVDVEEGETPVTRTFFAGGLTPFKEFVVTPQEGYEHYYKMDVVESALARVYTVGDTIKWGRSNLYYRPSMDTLRSYAFRAKNGLSTKADSYFSYEGKKPLQFPTEATKGDPCALVYPQGLWIQPTDVQVTTLTDGQGLLGDVLDAVGDILGGLLGTKLAEPSSAGSTAGIGYAQYPVITPVSTAFDDASNNLRIYYNGQITNVNVLSAIGKDGEGLVGLGLDEGLDVDLAGLDLADLGLTIPGVGVPVLQLPILGDSEGIQGAFWSRTGNIEIPLLGTKVGSWGYSAYNETPRFLGGRTGPDFVQASTTAELLSNLDLLGIDLLNTSFKNVRCVRNTAYNPNAAN